jgi:hypothetical protein
VTLTSISAYETTSGYSRGDTDGGAAANFPVGGVPNGFGQSMGQLRDLDQLTQEMRLASNGDDRLKWQVGALYFDSRDTTDFYQRGYFLKPGRRRNPNNWVRAEQPQHLVGGVRPGQLQADRRPDDHRRPARHLRRQEDQAGARPPTPPPTSSPMPAVATCVCRTSRSAGT